MNIIITGGFGYLGSNLAKFLQKKNTIYLISRQKKRKPAWLKNGKVFQVNWDNNTDKIKKIFLESDILIISSGVNASNCLKNPQEYLDYNKITLNKILSYCKKFLLKKVIYFSSAHIYSSNLSGYIDENSPLKNKHHYAISKKIVEKNIINFSKKNPEIHFYILRLSNVFGGEINSKSNSWNLVINDFCKSSVKFNKIIINSKKNFLRNFLPISDLFKLINVLIDLNNNYNYQIINVGTENSFSINKLALIIQSRFKKIFNKKPEIIINKKFDYKSFEYIYASIYRKKIIKFNKDSFNKDLDKVIKYTTKLHGQ